jgi:hypothetical protein
MNSMRAMRFDINKPGTRHTTILTTLTTLAGRRMPKLTRGLVRTVSALRTTWPTRRRLSTLRISGSGSGSGRLSHNTRQHSGTHGLTNRLHAFLRSTGRLTTTTTSFATGIRDTHVPELTPRKSTFPSIPKLEAYRLLDTSAAPTATATINARTTRFRRILLPIGTTFGDTGLLAAGRKELALKP